MVSILCRWRLSAASCWKWDGRLRNVIINWAHFRSFGYAWRPSDIHSTSRRNLSALPITETELRLMAAAAIIGLSRIPNAG